MIKIGEFSKMNKVTVKTLRYYDEIGLLSPSHVDEATGYRYYSGSQRMRLQRILALKQIGFSLHEIITAMSQDISTGEMIQHLHAKQVEISQKIELERKKQMQVQEYLEILEKEESIKNFWRLNKMIKVEISKKARNYILNSADTITVDLILACG